jgi:spore coat protein U-like protein
VIQCQVSAPAFYWGSRQQTQHPVFVQGSVGMTCSKQEGVKVDLDIELQGLPARRQRELRQGGDVLTYTLFLNPNYTLAWGDGSAGTRPITDSISLKSKDQTLTRTYILYGRLDGGEGAATGRYLDAVVTRLNYTASCQ